MARLFSQLSVNFYSRHSDVQCLRARIDFNGDEPFPALRAQRDQWDAEQTAEWDAEEAGFLSPAPLLCLTRQLLPP
jgi:hypothetical protein